jgi:hypothetical protein
MELFLSSPEKTLQMEVKLAPAQDLASLDGSA